MRYQCSALQGWEIYDKAWVQTLLLKVDEVFVQRLCRARARTL